MVAGNVVGSTPPVIPMHVLTSIAGYTAPRVAASTPAVRLYGSVCKHLRDMNLPYAVRHNVETHVVDVAFPDIKVAIDVLAVADDPVQHHKASMLKQLGWELIELNFDKYDYCYSRCKCVAFGR